MEGAKANYSAALLTSEACISKCNFTDASEKLTNAENSCLRQCFVKYFDAQMIIKNEMTNYVRGNPLWKNKAKKTKYRIPLVFNKPNNALVS